MSKGYGYIQYGIGLYGKSEQTAFSMAAKKMATQGTLLLEIELDGKTLYLSDKYITVGSYNYEGVVQEFGLNDISAGSGGIGEQSDISITLQNKRLAYMTTENRISEMLASYNFEGRQATIRQYFNGLTYAECSVLFSGRIQNVQFDALTFSFDVTDNTEIFREIPVNQISKQEYTNAPDESIGMPKLIIYGIGGDFSLNMTKDWTLFPTVQTNKITKQYMIADHIIGQTALPTLGPPLGQVYMYIEELKSYLLMTTYPNSSFSNISTGALITMNRGAKWTLYKRPSVIGSLYDLTSTDFSNAIDEDNTTTLTIGAGKKFYLTFGTLPELGPLSDSDLKLTINIDSASGSDPYASVYYYNIDYDAGITPSYSTGVNITATEVTAGYIEYTFGTDRTAHGEASGQEDKQNAWTWDELSKYQFGITVGVGNSIDITDIYLTVNNITFDTTRTIHKYNRTTKRLGG